MTDHTKPHSVRWMEAERELATRWIDVSPKQPPALPIDTERIRPCTDVGDRAFRRQVDGT